MDELIAVPPEAILPTPVLDASQAKEKDPLKAAFLEDVLALPQKVVDHINNLKDSHGQPAEARNTLAALVDGIYESARSENSDAESTKVLKTIGNVLSVGRDTVDFDQVEETMRVPKNLVGDIQRAAFAGDTIHSAMMHVDVDFPSPGIHSVNKRKGVETTIGLMDREGRVTERVSLGAQLKVILDAEAAR